MRERAKEGKIMRPKRNFLFVGTTVVTLGVVAAVIGPTTSNQAAPLPVGAPFTSSNGSKPPAGQYSGPLFALSYAYPAVSKSPPMPWRTAIGNGLITTANAGTYARALKQSIGSDMRVLLESYGNWNAAQRGWYNEPWLGPQREPIHGMYVGSSELGTQLFPKSGLTKPISTYVLTYYNNTAAITLNKIWGKTAQNPNITTTATQFAEGSIIVKASFITADGNDWKPMKGALVWPTYISTNATLYPNLDGNGGGDPNASPPVLPVQPALTNLSFMQFDIIVKDSKSAPKTGWVFSTLVFDNRLQRGSGGVWDQMVVLGAQWGNDPQANDPRNPRPKLIENWNNPAAPIYGGETFGWGQRLSGPNDGAMNDIVYDVSGKPVFAANAKNSSCMSCHSSAQWNTKNPAVGMESFLLPLTTPTPVAPPPGSPPPYDYIAYSPAPGSPLWLKWFQNRKGTVPMDPGSVAADFDMVLTFKSLPAWYAATTGQQHNLQKHDYMGNRLGGRAATSGTK
jgi:hypothetical protein